MTHRTDGTVFENVMELLTEAGFGGFCAAATILMNEAMKVERAIFPLYEDAVANPRVAVWRQLN